MARIQPVSITEQTPPIKIAFEDHVKTYGGRITNLKATLGHSLLAFQVYMEWYPLYEEIKKILGERLAYLYAWSISLASDCPLCSTFFRKMIIDAGESPDNLVLAQEDEIVLEFGSAISKNKGNIENSVYDKISKVYSKKEMRS